MLNLFARLGLVVLIAANSALQFVATEVTAAPQLVTDGWAPILNTGVVGCLLVYFLVRTEPRMARIERAIARSDKANMLLLIGVKAIAPEIRVQAQELIHEIDVATNGTK